jgi:hypothetical protein
LLSSIKGNTCRYWYMALINKHSQAVLSAVKHRSTQSCATVIPVLAASIMKGCTPYPSKPRELAILKHWTGNYHAAGRLTHRHKGGGQPRQQTMAVAPTASENS